MTALLLTKDELTELTGAKIRSRVARWLIANGWPHVTGTDGWPRVSRSYAESKLGGTVPKAPASANEPDFSSLQRPLKKAG